MYLDIQDWVEQHHYCETHKTMNTKVAFFREPFWDENSWNSCFFWRVLSLSILIIIPESLEPTLVILPAWCRMNRMCNS